MNKNIGRVSIPRDVIVLSYRIYPNIIKDIAMSIDELVTAENITINIIGKIFERIFSLSIFLPSIANNIDTGNMDNIIFVNDE